MNNQKHPKALITLIKNSEGAFYSKKWLFFRDFLNLEIDFRSHPKWRDNLKSIALKKNIINKNNGNF